MIKFFRKTVSLMLISTLMCGVCAINAFAYNVGDVIGKILFTDIVTYVEGTRVRSYNIKGRTAIVAQDLRALGVDTDFGVYFDESSRVLTINNTDIYSPDSTETVVFDSTEKRPAVGTPVGDVLYTDITTNFDSEPIESFNIGGLTCIYADDLGKLCGTYVWSEEERTVNVYRHGSHVKQVQKTSSVRWLDAVDSAAVKKNSTKMWSSPQISHIIENDDGSFTVVEITDNINIEKYDSNFNRTDSFAIKKELPLFGALYFGKDFNYIAFGQENLLEDNSREVIKIVIYNKDFVKISEVSVNNCKTRIPFYASGCDMYENDRFLVLHTSRSQYIENGFSPQTQLTVIVDKSTWSVCNLLGKYQYNHASHSLEQFVKLDDEKIITANYSDAAPVRGAFLQELDFYGKVLNTTEILSPGGNAGYPETGAMIGGFEISDTGYLVPANFVDKAVASDSERNIYLLWADRLTHEKKYICLAYYTGSGYSGGVPYIVKLQDGNFMILWQQFGPDKENKVCYVFTDGMGNIIGKTNTVTARLSDSCQPIAVYGKVVWYVNTENGRDFYSMNAWPSVTRQTHTSDENEEIPVKEEPSATEENTIPEETPEKTEKQDTVETQKENSENINESQEKENNKFTEVEGV